MYSGSCHCGRIAFEVEGEVSEVKECICSHCSRKGYLLWFVPRTQLRLKTPFLPRLRLRAVRHRDGAVGCGDRGRERALPRGRGPYDDQAHSGRLAPSVT